MVKVCASRLSPVVYTGSLDGVVRGWDLRSGEVVKEWHGHSNHILDMTLTRWAHPLTLTLTLTSLTPRNESAILSASSDGTVRVFTM